MIELLHFLALAGLALAMLNALLTGVCYSHKRQGGLTFCRLGRLSFSYSIRKV